VPPCARGVSRPGPPHPPGRFLCRRVLVCLGSERWCRCVERRGVVIDDGPASSRRQGEGVLVRSRFLGPVRSVAKGSPAVTRIENTLWPPKPSGTRTAGNRQIGAETIRALGSSPPAGRHVCQAVAALSAGVTSAASDARSRPRISPRAATVKKAGVAMRPVSILRKVSTGTPAAAATSTMLRSPRA